PAARISRAWTLWFLNISPPLVKKKRNRNAFASFGRCEKAGGPNRHMAFAVVPRLFQAWGPGPNRHRALAGVPRPCPPRGRANTAVAQTWIWVRDSSQTLYFVVWTQRKPMCDMPVSGVHPCRALGR